MAVTSTEMRRTHSLAPAPTITRIERTEQLTRLETRHLSIAQSGDAVKMIALARDPKLTILAAVALSELNNPHVLLGLVENPSPAFAEYREKAFQALVRQIESGALDKNAALAIGKSTSPNDHIKGLQDHLSMHPQSDETEIALMRHKESKELRVSVMLNGTRSLYVDMIALGDRFRPIKEYNALTTRHESVMLAFTELSTEANLAELESLAYNRNITSRVRMVLREKNNIRITQALENVSKGLVPPGLFLKFKIGRARR